ncbi:CoA transferase [Actinomadura sp. HBU206391]|uniref:CoA transferase n=1 Tax=Actinomadura sp. HBU206391 TaxID=2731692 RepID=UPI00164F1649|nr:CoA transferase [Actinomadura sp. HBU206391]MBC6459481.1 CoA transferase [Actinomadura sp. HBU206391]
MLDGLRVLEISSFVAAPLGGMTLAQLGAEVIRVDPIGGAPDVRRWPLAPSGASLYWAGLNKGKRSVTVDLRSPRGREIVSALAADTGVVLTNAPRPSYEELAAARPDLIHLRIEGHHDGRPAVDYTVNAETGFPLATGPEDHTDPVNNVVPAWDIACGLYAAVGILAAERHRSRTGEGSALRLPLADVALATAGNLGLLGAAVLGGGDRPRIGNHLYGGFARDFATADGERVMLVTLTARHFADLCAVTGLAEVFTELGRLLGADFGADADRYRHREAIAALIEPWFAARTLAEVSKALSGCSVLWSPYRTFTEAARAATANPLMTELDQPGIGRHPVPGSPIVSGAGRGAALAPALGSDTDDVLTEIGLDAGEIVALRGEGIVA